MRYSARFALMNSTVTCHLAVLITGLLVCGCALLEERPRDTEGLQPSNAPFYEVLKDRYTQNPDLLVGTWKWQFSTAYYWGEDGLRTETEGKTITLKFHADGTLETYRNGGLEGSKSYHVKRREYDNGTVSEYPMLFISGRSSEFVVSQDTLLISTMDKDGPESIYAKID